MARLRLVRECWRMARFKDRTVSRSMPVVPVARPEHTQSKPMSVGNHAQRAGASDGGPGQGSVPAVSRGGGWSPVVDWRSSTSLLSRSYCRHLSNRKVDVDTPGCVWRGWWATQATRGGVRHSRVEHSRTRVSAGYGDARTSRNSLGKSPEMMSSMKSGGLVMTGHLNPRSCKHTHTTHKFHTR